MERVRFKDNELAQGRGYEGRYKRDMRVKKRREQVLGAEDGADGTSIGRKCKAGQQLVQANQETGNYWQVMLTTAAEVPWELFGEKREGLSQKIKCLYSERSSSTWELAWEEVCPALGENFY